MVFPLFLSIRIMDYQFFYKTQFQEVYYIPKTGNITIFVTAQVFRLKVKIFQAVAGDS